ncbi:MAG: Biotin carboxyl carrier protein [Chloroflexi bacterium]|nr:MAG: Biotin carboxyl carrier protein [Chloroflexota bacterium]
MAIRRLTLNEINYSIAIKEDSNSLIATITNLETNEETSQIIDYYSSINGQKINLIINGSNVTIFVQHVDGKTVVTIDNILYVVESSESSKKRGSKGSSGDPEGIISAPLAGIVTKINVALGDIIEAGKTVCIVEAMKMQNEIKIPINGVITAIDFNESDRVEKNEIIIRYDVSE